MNVQAARENFEAAEKGLSELTERKSVISEKIETLQKTRQQSVKALATGDKAARKKIEDADAKLQPLLLEQEGISILIQDAQKAVEAAKGIFREAEEEEKAASEAFLKKRNLEEALAALADCPGQIKRKIQDLIAWREGLGEIRQVIHRASTAGLDTHEVADELFKLVQRINESVKAEGLRPLASSGTAGELGPLLWPLTRESSAIVAEIEQRRSEQRRAVWAEEFLQKQTGE